MFKSINLERGVRLPGNVELVDIHTVDPNIIEFASVRQVKDKFLYLHKTDGNAYFYSLTKDKNDRHSMIHVELLEY